MNDLPVGWAETTIGSCLHVRYGKAAPKGDEGRVPVVASSGIIRYTTESLATGRTLVVGRKGGVGRVQIFSGPIWPTDTTYSISVPDALSDKYLFYQIASLGLKRLDRSTAVPSLQRQDLEAAIIRIAPQREQERIVAAIEERFSLLDAAMAALERARQNLHRMKSALLRDSWNHAMSAAGGLSRVTDLLDIPPANGRSVPDATSNGFPVLRLTCVRDGVIDDTETKAGAWTAEQAKPYLLREGDFLVIRGNGSKHLVGRGGAVMRDAAVAYPDTLIRIRTHPNRITVGFLGLLWNSSSVRGQLEKAARTTAGIYKINQQSLGLIELPAPAVDIQARIVSEADRGLSRIHVLDAEIATAFGRTSRLRSAILAAAFSGKLVVQDPSDEPASALLERIASKSALSSGQKTGGARKPGRIRQRVLP